MPNQPTSKRLLTEATAGAAVTNPATPLGAALAGATGYVPKSVLGKPSGVAVLGADGLVPSSQLPASNTTFVTTKPAATSRASTVTPALDPDLQSAVLPGTYVFDVTGAAGVNGAASGLIIAVGGTATFTVPNGGVVTALTSTAMTVQQWGNGVGTTAVALGTNSSAYANIGFTARTVVVVTAAGTIGLSWAQSVSSASASTLLARSSLMLTRVGA
jgi:hypothetical protein